MTFGTPGQGQNPLAYSDRRLSNVPAIRLQRAPGEGDNNYPLMTHALDESTGDVWVLYEYLYKNRAQWQKIVESSATGDIMTLSDTSDAKTGPDATGNVKLYSPDDATTMSPTVTITTDEPNNQIAFSLPDGPETACANYIVDPMSTKAQYSTISAAVTAASAGDTIFIKEGSYTEDITVSKKLTFYAFGCQERQSNVTVTGKWTISSDCIIRGMQLAGNAMNDVTIEVSANVTHIQDCKMKGNVNGAISLTGGEVVAYCIGCDGGQLFNMTGGLLSIFNSYTRSSSVNSTASAGTITIQNTTTTNDDIDLSGTASLRFYNSNCVNMAITTADTSTVSAYNSRFEETSAVFLTTAGTGTNVIDSCEIISAAQTCITVGSGTQVECYNTSLDSSNADVIDGAGTLIYAGLTFAGTSADISTTTQTIRKIGPNAEYSGTSHLLVPSGTTAQQPGSPVNGMIRYNSTDGNLEGYSGGAWVDLTAGAGSGDVVGPGSATDEAIARFDTTTGKLIQNSVMTITDAGVCDGCTQFNVDNLRLDGNTLSSTDTNGNINLTPDGSGVIAGTELTLTTDLAVDYGGSGRSSATAYAVICGGTTSTGAHQSIASVGTSGQVLTSNGAGALPTFQNASGSSPLTTKGDIYTYDTGDARLAIGTNEHTLIADSSAATGNKWGVLQAAGGGTGQSSYTAGDILYATGATTLSKLGVGSIPGDVIVVDKDGSIQWDTDVIVIKDDFLGTGSTLEQSDGWDGLFSATGNADLIDGTADHPGIYELSVSANSDDAVMSRGTTSPGTINPLIVGSGFMRFDFLIQLPTLADVTDDYSVWIGLGNGTPFNTGINGEGIGFEYIRSTSTNWNPFTETSSTQTSASGGSSVAVDTNWTHLRMEIDATATTVSFWIDGTDAGTSTTNIPSGGLSPMLKITKTAGSSERTLLIDAYRFYYQLTNTRWV